MADRTAKEPHQAVNHGSPVTGTGQADKAAGGPFLSVVESTAAAHDDVAAQSFVAREARPGDEGNTPNPRPIDGVGDRVTDSAKKKSDPQKRGGRPPGSKNKRTKDIQEFLSQQGWPGVKTLCRFADGRPIYRVLKGGARERIDPTIEQIMEAARITSGWQIPTLRAIEKTIDQTNRTAEPDEPTSRQLARALGLLAVNASVDDAHRDDPAAEHGGTSGADSDIPESASLGVSPSPSEAPSRTPSGDGRSPPFASETEIGERELVGETGAFITCTRIEKGAGGRERWHVYSHAAQDFGGFWSRAEARTKAAQLVEQRKI